MLIEYFHNKQKNTGEYPNELRQILNLENSKIAFDEIKTWNGYTKTPLHLLSKIASEIGVKNIYYKDESSRFDLGSFKALGGTYGVLKFIHHALQLELGKGVSIQDIHQGKYSKQVLKYTVTTATDGNHGRSVAFGAKLFGCKCQIYIHSEVSAGRQKAMEDLGANVVRISGNYDESLQICIDDAKKNNWHVISDTSYEGYTKYPRYIMAGYNVMAEEISDQIKDRPLPTNIFLQGGVGSFPAAICGYFWEKFPDNNIKFVVVESEHAPCLIRSAQNNQMTLVNIKQETMMAGLSCGEPSLLGWEILRLGADDFITINDSSIPRLMRLLAKNSLEIEAGESSVAGLAGLMESMKDRNISEAMGLNEESIVLLFGTEGATDPEIYSAIVSE
jgi:diaminopropionate ammonia-lyase